MIAVHPFSTAFQRVVLRAGLGLLLLAGVAFLSSCSKHLTDVEKGNRAGILYRGSGTEPEALDPHVVRGVTEWTIVGSLFEGLVVPEPDKPGTRGGAADRWDVSSDGLVYTFHLRNDARWSDGSPVTAADFEYSMRRLLTPALGSAHSEDTLFFIRNARAYQTGKITDFKEVGIQVVDAHTLVLTLENPAPFFLGALYQVYPVKREVIEKFGAISDRNSVWTRPENIVSNGPFRLVRWLPNQEIVVARSPSYWDAASVRLNEVHFLPYENPSTEEAAFRNGQLHMTNMVPVSKLESYQKETPSPLHTWSDFGNYFYSVNVRRAPYSDVRVRRALAWAVDREALAKRLLGGRMPATSFTPPGLGDYRAPAGKLPFDPVAARRLLAEAGFPEGRGFPAVEILIDGREPHKMVAEMVQHMWKSTLGLDVRIRSEETRSLIASKRSFDFSLVRGSWNASSYQDPHYFISSWVTGGLYNEAGWSQPAFDRIIASAVTTADPAARLERFNEAETILLDELPVIPLFFSAQTVLASPSIHGWSGRPYSDRIFKSMWLE